MKALILDGFRQADTGADLMPEIIESELAKRGWSIERLVLRDIAIAPCKGCFNCWVNTPGECCIDDPGRDVARKMMQSDFMLFLTPVTFGGYSSTLKKAVDRLIPNVLPFFRVVDGEVHLVPRYVKYPRLGAVGVVPQSNSEISKLFNRLVKRNSINFYSGEPVTAVVAAEDGSERIRSRISSMLTSMGVVK